GALALSGIVTTTHADGTATLKGNINLGSADRSFNIFDGLAAVDMEYNGTLAGSGTRRLTKDGAGTLQLSGTNTSSTIGVRVNAGGLIVTNKNALGGAQFFYNGGTFQA